MKSLVTVSVAALLLAACAGGAPRRSDAGPPNEYVAYAGAPVDHFHFWKLDSWQSVGHGELVIWTTPWDAYLVTVSTPCSDLNFAERIGVTSTVGEISKFESIVVGRSGQRCPITAIRPIDLKQMKADRAADRADAKARREQR